MNLVKYSICIRLLLITLFVSTGLKTSYLKAQDAATINSDIPIIYITKFPDCIGATDPACNDVDEDEKDRTIAKIFDSNNSPNRINNTDYDSTIINIEYRGDATFPKRSFTLETQRYDSLDQKFDNYNLNLLGLPSENDWIFNAPYQDKSLIRNALVYDLVREMGWYAPRTKFFNLIKDLAEFTFENGVPSLAFEQVYEGLYVLTERIKRDDDRVDIAELRVNEVLYPNPNNSEDVTGGYIVQIDEEENNITFEGWESETGSWKYVYVYPDDSDINAPIQTDYIQGVFNNFETIMNSPNFNDPINGYASHINVESFIDFIIVQEFTKNVDGYRTNGYFHKNKNSSGDSLIYAGPVWDFNIALGNTALFDGAETTGFQYDFNNKFDDPKQVPFYWSKLMTDPDFVKKLKCRYTQLRGTVLSNENVFDRINSFETVLKQSADLNFQRWQGVLNAQVPEGTPNNFATYQAAVDAMEDWLTARFAFLDSQWLGEYFDVKSASSAAICPGDEVVLSVEVEGNSTGSFDWAIGDNIIASNVGSSLTIDEADPTITYTVTGYNDGCADTALVKVNVPGFESASGGGNKTICPGEIDTLEARGARSYRWKPLYGFVNEADVNVARPLVSPAMDTVYQVTLITQAGCEIIDSVKVKVRDVVPLMVDEDITTCTGVDIQLSAAADSLSGFTWVANPPDSSLEDFEINLPNPTVRPAIDTEYIVTTNSSVCDLTDTVTVKILTDTTIDFGSYAACVGETIEIDCPDINALSVVWEPSIADNSLCPEITVQSNMEYTVKAEIAGGCVLEGSLKIDLSEGNAINAGSDRSVCAGEMIQLNATGGSANFLWEGSDAFSNTTIANPTITLEETTTLKVSSFGAGGCDSEDEITITIIPNPLSVAANEIVKCQNEDAVQLQASGTDSYNWNPSTGLSDNNIANPLANPSQTTSYTVFTIIESCIFEESVEVIVNQAQNYEVGTTLTLCNGNSGQLFASGGVEYRWQPALALDNPASPTPTVDANSLVDDTTYEVSITDANGCSSILTQSVILKSGRDIIEIDEVSICTGGQTELSATGGQSYFWEVVSGDESSITGNANIANITVKPTEETTYKLNFTDVDGCEFTDEITVKIASNIDANAGEDKSICIGENVELNTFGGSQYLWTNNTTLATHTERVYTVSPTETTTYAVVVSDAGCQGTDEVTITVNPLPQPQITGPTAICGGESAELSVNEHQTYNWSSSDNINFQNTATVSVNPTNNTSYTVEVSNENGCTAQADFQLTVNPVPVISISEVAPICEGSSTQLSTSISDNSANLSWSTEQESGFSNIANPSVSPSTTTLYNLEAGIDRCSSTASILVEVNPLPSIEMNQSPIGDCNSNQIQLTASGGTNYTWQPTTGLSNPNVSNPIATVTDATTFSVTVEDENGCSNSSSIEVKPGEGLAGTITKDVSICRGESIRLEASGGNQYQWFPAGNLSASDIANPLASPTNTTDYRVDITDTNINCTVSKLVTVSVKESPQAFAPDKSVCEGKDIQLELQTSPGSSIQWLPEEGLSNATINNPTVSISEDKQYTVAVTNDESGCIGRDTVNIIIKPKPTAFVGNDTTICSAQRVNLNAVSNNENAEFSWQPANIIANANDQNTTANITANTTITLSVTGQNGCATTANRNINISENVTAVVNEAVTVCEGGSATLSASGGDSYLWEPADFLNNPNISNPTITPQNSNELIYTVTVFDERGCSDTKTVNVSIDDNAEPDAGEDIQLCIGESSQLFAAGGTTYEWSTATGTTTNISNPNIYNPIVNPTTTTRYILTVNKGTLCQGTDEVVVSVVEELEVVIAQGDLDIFPGQSITLNASGADVYEWQTNDNSISCTDCANPIISPNVSTQYTVKGTSGSCEGYATITVNIANCNLETNITEDVIICGEASSAQLDFSSYNNYTYQWTGNNVSTLSCTNCPNPVATPNETTTYQVKISDSFCEKIETVVVTVLDDAIFFPKSKVQLCNNETLAYNIENLSDYTLQPQSGFTITDKFLVFTPTINRTYTLTGQLSGGCSFVEQLEITVKDAPEINLGEDQFLCKGKEIILNENFNAQGAVANWLPISGLNNPSVLKPVAQPEETTTYTIQLEENGCIATDEITITVVPNNFATANKNATICEGGRVQLSASGGVNYSWSPANTLNNASIATPVASPASDTAYQVEVEDENGCIDKAIVNVKISDQLNLKLKDEFTICEDGNGVKLETEGAFSYSWQPSNGLSSATIANPVANPANTTAYTLTATDGACTVTKTTTVNVVNQSLTAHAGEDVTICEGDEIRLKATGGLGYVWSNPETLSSHTVDAPMATPARTTTYTVTTANILGCTDFDEVTVFVNEGDNELSISSNRNICQGESTPLEITFKPGYKYKWLPASGLSNAEIFNPTAAPQKNTNYNVDVTDSEGCTSTYSVAVNVAGLDQVSAGDDIVICKNETVQLNATGSERYLWNASATLSELNISNPVASPQTSTNYIVQLNSNGCSKTDTVFVEVADLASFSQNEQITVCEGSDITLRAEGGDRYNWSSTDFSFQQPTLQYQTITPTSQTSNFQVEISKANCIAQKQIEVLLGPPTDFALKPTYEVCKNGTVQLNLEGENLSNISWFPSGGLNNANTQNPVATVSDNVIYTASFTANNTCTAQASTSIQLVESLDLSTNANEFTICEGAIQTLTANSSLGPVVNYQWTIDNEFFAAGNEIVVKPNNTTTYTVTGNLNECSTSKEVTVNVINFDAEAGSINDFEVCFGDDAQLNAQGGTNYQWQPAALLSDPFVANPVTKSITEPTQFYVEVKIFACTLRDSVVVSPKECLVEFIPNSFTPNNDGVNDTWVIPEITRFDNNELFVYNRWGQLVYSAVNYQNDWDGSFNGTSLPEATYYYILKVREDSESLQGTVTIIR